LSHHNYPCKTAPMIAPCRAAQHHPASCQQASDFSPIEACDTLWSQCVLPCSSHQTVGWLPGSCCAQLAPVIPPSYLLLAAWLHCSLFYS